MKDIRDELSKIEALCIKELDRQESREVMRRMDRIDRLLERVERMYEAKEDALDEKGIITGMPPKAFMQVMNILKNDFSFDKDRVSYLETVSETNVFTAGQVSLCMDELVFDKHKLSLLKALYPKIVDKENVHKLVLKFKFNSFKEKAKEFIKEQESDEEE